MLSVYIFTVLKLYPQYSYVNTRDCTYKKIQDSGIIIFTIFIRFCSFQFQTYILELYLHLWYNIRVYY